MQWLIDIIEETVQTSFQGIIVAWSGAIVDIPSGWALCDGTNGTPNLEDRFIIGAGDTFNPNDTGGAIDHDHSFTSNPHSHNHAAGTDFTGGVGFNQITDAEVVVGITDTETTGPPYYALAFIMKT